MADIQRDREADLDKLAEAFFENLERETHCEYGGWGLDDKRPFGNSYVAGDILEIIGWEPAAGRDDSTAGQGYLSPESGYSAAQEEYAHALYDDLGDHLRKRWSER